MAESGRHPRRAAVPTSDRDAGTLPKTTLRAEAAIDAVRQRSLDDQQRQWIDYWRRELRPRAVGLIAARAHRLSWSPALLALVLEELGADDDLFVEQMVTARTIPPQRYAQALAVAIALRHSWRPDSLTSVAKRLGIPLTLFALCRAKKSHPASPRAAGTSRPTKTKQRRASAAENGKRQ